MVNQVSNLLNVPDTSFMEKVRPIGIKLIAYFHYFLIITFIGSFVYSLIAKSSFSAFGILQMPFGSIFVILSLALVVVLSLICFWAGQGIWKGENSWRIFVIIIAAIVGILQLVSLLSYFSNSLIGSFFWNFLLDLAYLGISFYILIYLLFFRSAKFWFKK
jgi:hypothetical protein